MLSGLRDMFVSNGYTLQTALSNHRLLQPIHLEFITNVVTWQPQIGILVKCKHCHRKKISGCFTSKC